MCSNLRISLRRNASGTRFGSEAPSLRKAQTLSALHIRAAPIQGFSATALTNQLAHFIEGDAIFLRQIDKGRIRKELMSGFQITISNGIKRGKYSPYPHELMKPPKKRPPVRIVERPGGLTGCIQLHVRPQIRALVRRGRRRQHRLDVRRAPLRPHRQKSAPTPRAPFPRILGVVPCEPIPSTERTGQR